MYIVKVHGVYLKRPASFVKYRAEASRFPTRIAAQAHAKHFIPHSKFKVVALGYYVIKNGPNYYVSPFRVEAKQSDAMRFSKKEFAIIPNGFVEARVVRVWQ